ncbi:MAG: hypothetical protein AAGK14_08615 [Verrucomicrobiota bacterium]
MKTHRHTTRLRRRHRRRGVALVISLGFVVLLTMLVTSYLVSMRLDRQSTYNYSQSMRAQELARGAMEEILADLKQEIEAGSLDDGVYTVNDKRVYVPRTPEASQPARLGFDATMFGTDVDLEGEELLPPTLLRVSRASNGASDDLYNDVMDSASSDEDNYDADLLPANRASAVPTFVEGESNRRQITPERWNKPMLMGVNPPSNFEDNPPDWIYVTRSGSRPFTDDDVDDLKPARNSFNSNQLMGNDTQLMGRYAYTIYFTGGLLDANVVGRPEIPTTNSGQTAFFDAIRGKSALAFADLGAIPGFSDLTQDKLESQIDAFVNWRNRGSMEKASQELQPGEMTFLKMVKNLREYGYLEMESGDSPLLGRQDLLQYFTDTGLPQSALPYLTTFSKASNAPAWSPKADSNDLRGYEGGVSTTVVNYKQDKLDPDSPNPMFQAVRFQSNGKVRRYRDDGSSSPHPVEKGEPLLQRRFSLAKLSWLTDMGPAPGISEEAIQACFGLLWNSGDNRWDYVGPSGSSPETEIDTLHDVAGQMREPNFFEMLKAGILTGSLGRDPGKLATEGSFAPTNRYPQGGPVGDGFDLYKDNRDQQIIQIGANAIDQYDTDSFPTTIYFKVAGDPSAPEQGPINLSFGVENLPYLSKIDWVSMQTGAQEYKAWYQPELWNPHQASGFPSNGPTNFRITAYGQSYIEYAHNSSNAAGVRNRRQSSTLDFNVNSNAANIYFSDEDAGAEESPFYDRPRATTFDTADVTKTHKDNVLQDSYLDFQAEIRAGYPDVNEEQQPNEFVGFNAGVISDFDVDEKKGNSPKHRLIPSPMVTFTLYYEDRSGEFQPYDSISRIRSYYYQDFSSWGQTKPKVYYVPVDPRQGRFSAHLCSGGHGNNMFENTYRIEMGKTRRAAFGYPNDSAGFHYGLNPPYQGRAVGEFALNIKPPAGSGTNWAYYTDVDGVVRPADGFRRTQSGDGIPQLPASQRPESAENRRPVVLDRPFNSVAELGYCFRDLPYRNLDFWSEFSADAALLELFSVQNESEAMAGQVNVNFAPSPVLQSLLAGAARKSIDPSLNLDLSQSKAVAEAIATQQSVSTATPLQNRSDLVTELSDVMINALPEEMDQANKAMAEAPIRALSEVTNMRTWNLMIDVVAQSGNLQATANSLEDFVVVAETRRWVHVAIDRYTGKVVAMNVETVYE